VGYDVYLVRVSLNISNNSLKYLRFYWHFVISFITTENNEVIFSIQNAGNNDRLKRRDNFYNV